ncbi:MAG: serine protease [Chloroflexi bacterium]|nr:MAG: serine protease [Chloroflexota bacterium]
MDKLGLALVVLLIVTLVSGPGCALLRNETGSSNATGSPICPDWEPLYIDTELGPPLSSTRELVEMIGPTVVSVVTEKITRDMFFQPVPKRGAGSGIIVDPNGFIVTNNHVVEGATSVTVTLSDGNTFDVIKWATDPWTDLAVLQINPGRDLPYAHFLEGSLEKLEALDEVVAVGNALALPGGPTWSKGVVSNLGRSIQLSGDVVVDDVIQTDAAINPGNSGGPLVNMAGQVVGINTAIAAEAENIGFAISTDTAIPVVNNLVRKSRVPCAWLGVSVLSVTQSLQEQEGLVVDRGALIVTVASGSPADEAGLKAGDVIVKLGDWDVTSSEELVDAIQSYNAGDTVEITCWRGSQLFVTEATLIQRPSL